MKALTSITQPTALRGWACTTRAPASGHVVASTRSLRIRSTSMPDPSPLIDSQSAAPEQVIETAAAVQARATRRRSDAGVGTAVVTRSIVPQVVSRKQEAGVPRARGAGRSSLRTVSTPARGHDHDRAPHRPPRRPTGLAARRSRWPLSAAVAGLCRAARLTGTAPRAGGDPPGLRSRRGPAAAGCPVATVGGTAGAFLDRGEPGAGGSGDLGRHPAPHHRVGRLAGGRRGRDGASPGWRCASAPCPRGSAWRPCCRGRSSRSTWPGRTSRARPVSWVRPGWWSPVWASLSGAARSRGSPGNRNGHDRRRARQGQECRWDRPGSVA